MTASARAARNALGTRTIAFRFSYTASTRRVPARRSEHAVQRARHLREIERLDEQRPGVDLPAAVAADETPELIQER
jgi:hypothetical protein